MRVLVGIAFLSVLFGGCNPYTLVDSPSGDDQLLSKARACFDKGDFECASKYYGQLSEDSSDRSNSEQAFMLLAQNGVTVGVFMSAIIDGSSNGGTLVTKIANALISKSGQSTRMAIFQAYQKTGLIVDRRTRGLMRFITACSLIGELLAEDAGSSGKLKQSDLVTDPTICLDSKMTLYTSPGCNPPSGKKLITGTPISSLRGATDAQISGPSGSPTLHMIHAAVKEVEEAISEMESNGSLGSSASNFANQLIGIENSALSGDSPAYRATLIEFGVGEK